MHGPESLGRCGIPPDARRAPGQDVCSTLSQLASGHTIPETGIGRKNGTFLRGETWYTDILDHPGENMVYRHILAGSLETDIDVGRWGLTLDVTLWSTTI